MSNTLAEGRTSMTFSVRMDTDMKNKLDEFCRTVGITANTAINMFASVVVRKNRLPFYVAVEPFQKEDADCVRRDSVHNDNSIAI